MCSPWSTQISLGSCLFPASAFPFNSGTELRWNIPDFRTTQGPQQGFPWWDWSIPQHEHSHSSGQGLGFFITIFKNNYSTAERLPQKAHLSQGAAPSSSRGIQGLAQKVDENLPWPHAALSPAVAGGSATLVGSGQCHCGSNLGYFDSTLGYFGSKLGHFIHIRLL